MAQLQALPHHVHDRRKLEFIERPIQDSFHSNCLGSKPSASRAIACAKSPSRAASNKLFAGGASGSGSGFGCGSFWSIISTCSQIPLHVGEIESGDMGSGPLATVAFRRPV
jgi:hypothetical protein